MKKYPLIVLLFLFCGHVFSQQVVPPPRIFSDDENDKTFYGGITFGGNISEVIGDAYHGYHKIGWRVGPGVIAKFPDKMLGFSFELLYSQKGSRGVRQLTSNYSGDYFEKYFLDLNYVEVPLQLLLFPNARTNFGVGVSYSRLIKSKERIYDLQPTYNFHESDFPFLKDDWCILVSAKYQFWRGWFIGASYTRSLRAVREYYNVPPFYGSGNQYNMYFSLTVSYFLH